MIRNTDDGKTQIVSITSREILAEETKTAK